MKRTALRHPVLLIHGGAGRGRYAPERKLEIARSLRRIVEAVYVDLDRGASALECVTEAVRHLEDDPLFNAGKGSKIQRDGHIRMSASVMDGAKRSFAGCVNVEGLKNPITLARSLLGAEDRVLASRGAEAYARHLGLPFASPFTPHARDAFARAEAGKSGTVGAVALDARGRLAAATSTGGRGHEHPHRVSDSPTCAGNYADRLAALSLTGTGEEIVDFAAAARICAFVEGGWSLERAVDHVLGQARRARAQFGLIALDHRGRWIARSTTQILLWAHCGRAGYASGFTSKRS